MKKFTIKTAYSTEIYYCNDIDAFLTEICFCDEYEIITEEEAEKEKIELYNNTIQKLICLGIEIDTFWTNQVLLLITGYYETFDEMYENTDMDEKAEAKWERVYTSCTARDYSPSNPWDAPGMSVRDFI